jgi:hypothetical protein
MITLFSSSPFPTIWPQNIFSTFSPNHVAKNPFPNHIVTKAAFIITSIPNHMVTKTLNNIFSLSFGLTLCYVTPYSFHHHHLITSWPSTNYPLPDLCSGFQTYPQIVTLVVATAVFARTLEAFVLLCILFPKARVLHLTKVVITQGQEYYVML